MFFKYIILFFIFVGSTSIGFTISKGLKNRVEDLKEFKTSLNIMKNKIRFTYKPLDEIFEDISKVSKRRCIRFFLEKQVKI